jgi:hypothetical protein
VKQTNCRHMLKHKATDDYVESRNRLWEEFNNGDGIPLEVLAR